jgi:hypothetical protein
MAHEPGSEQARLAALIGRWRTQGWTRETAEAPAARIEATDTYEWLPGRFAVLHTVDARIGEERVEGAEIIGWDPARSAYVTQYFGSDGPNATPTRSPLRPVRLMSCSTRSSLRTCGARRCST